MSATTMVPNPARANERYGGGVRLTRRGRVVMWLMVVALVCTVLVLVAAPAVSTGTPHHARTEVVVVSPGQTLWDIARSVAPEQDPRAVVAELADLNGLSDAGALRVGQPLVVPVNP